MGERPWYLMPAGYDYYNDPAPMLTAPDGTQVQAGPEAAAKYEELMGISGQEPQIPAQQPGGQTMGRGNVPRVTPMVNRPNMNNPNMNNQNIPMFNKPEKQWNGDQFERAQGFLGSDGYQNIINAIITKGVR